MASLITGGLAFIARRIVLTAMNKHKIISVLASMSSSASTSVPQMFAA